jgi:uncharacterized protein (TIGR02246 family)
VGRFSRDELEEAFAAYQKASAEAATTGDWDRWVEVFTPDATWVEHQLPDPVVGRDAMKAVITQGMQKPPMDQMKYFPIDWYIIDDERGWIVCSIWNRMEDPGDGSVHQAYNFTLLKYAGDGKWSYQEDVYNPKRFEDMIAGWVSAKEAAST